MPGTIPGGCDRRAVGVENRRRPAGYRIAEQFGLKIVPRPHWCRSVGPETLARFGDLSEFFIDAEVSCNGGRFRENLL